MENINHLTPVKSEVQTPGGQDFDVFNEYQPFNTPCSVSSAASDGSHMMDCLTGSFTGMKLNINGGAKRDRVTIEGSPMVPLPFKQPNLNPTPHKTEEEWSINDFYNSGSTGIGFPTNTSSPQGATYPNDYQSVNAVKIDPAFHASPVRSEAQQLKKEHQQKVLVICSASSEHNTGDHQENMLRTALLCGEKGCLRRPELAAFIDWVDSDTIQAAPLCDLLRCVK
jgi:hypothetical protein